MKTPGFDTRKRFDQLVVDALRLKDPALSRRQLDELLQNCIACHASYQRVAASP